MQAFLDITKALADETRVRALMSLSEGELCVCQIISLLKLSPSTVSKHMSILQQAGLVTRRKQGRWHYYRLNEKSPDPTVRQALRWTRKSLGSDKTIAGDCKSLCCLRRKDPSELTACYNEC